MFLEKERYAQENHGRDPERYLVYPLQQWQPVLDIRREGPDQRYDSCNGCDQGRDIPYITKHWLRVGRRLFWF